MKSIGVITVGRSDYGIYLPLLKRIQADPDLSLQLIVSGMHLSPEFGSTIKDIHNDGFPIADQVEFLLSSDTPEGVVKSMGLGTIGYAQTFTHLHLDMLFVLGDRFEMHAAALAALPYKIPVAHIHGGELTLGAIDDALRHSITKLSHLHFVSTKESGQRILQLGEEPWRVILCGALSLDNLDNVEILSFLDFKNKYNITIKQPYILVTYHPVTLEYDDSKWHIKELLVALENSGLPVLFTMPNADTGGRSIRYQIIDYVENHSKCQVVENLGLEGYFNAMAHAKLMAGNSSSGIIEAPSFQLPVVNIGNRQDGRVRGNNVIDVGYQNEEILTGLRMASSTSFRESLNCNKNPYYFGKASKIIVEHIKQPFSKEILLKKQFYLP
jgi:UDP-hydrolysing UDP-N-acetyl-D-glucosamine 2-epimerase